MTSPNPHNSANYYIGVMSGTSLDGVDCAIVEISDGNIQLIAAQDYSYPAPIREKVLDVCLGQKTSLKEIGELDHQLGHLYAKAISHLLLTTGIDKQQIKAIGNHGQTVFHQPQGDTPFTMQLGDANIIAALTSIDTVADFRRKDMALGGQGAPLVPAFHKALFPVENSSIVVLNIGGIANISVLRPNRPVIGFDTGPGNMLMDAWCERHQGLKFDKNAQFALQGDISEVLLTRLLNEPYLQQQAPKSTGRELFNLEWLDAQIADLAITPQDVQRTLAQYTIITIANEVKHYHLGTKPQLMVCGGGVHNPLLMQGLEQQLPQWRVSTTDEHGVSSDNMEAMAFAWLAYCRMHNRPSNLPEVTGASQPASLGVVYYA